VIHVTGMKKDEMIQAYPAPAHQLANRGVDVGFTGLERWV